MSPRDRGHCPTEIEIEKEIEIEIEVEVESDPELEKEEGSPLPQGVDGIVSIMV